MQKMKYLRLPERRTLQHTRKKDHTGGNQPFVTSHHYFSEGIDVLLSQVSKQWKATKELHFKEGAKNKDPGCFLQEAVKKRHRNPDFWESHTHTKA